MKDQDDRNKFLTELVEPHCSQEDRITKQGKFTIEDTQVEIWGSKKVKLMEKK